MIYFWSKQSKSHTAEVVHTLQYLLVASLRLKNKVAEVTEQQYAWITEATVILLKQICNPLIKL